jgi:hypothetical protein
MIIGVRLEAALAGMRWKLSISIAIIGAAPHN